MKNFIYSIKDIFNKETGCLFDNKVDGYFIAPYQRGYKWKSDNVHDQVPVLLLDIYEAFVKNSLSNSNQEYYLQYITVKKQDNLFEVIDGQQRLTTLTLLFNVLETFFSIENCAKKGDMHLVSYARYEQENIFKSIIDLLSENFDESILKEQDKFYMLKGSKCIKSFFDILTKNVDKKEFNDFISYLKENVKIIVNQEDENTSAEEVFANLNDNKVPLTNSYLIKGLLLTKASRLSLGNKVKHFTEIMDERVIMGRIWDEMNTWFSNKDIALYFFGNENNGMENMLRLINFKTLETKTEVIQNFKESFDKTINSYNNPYELFNEFHEHIISSHDAFYYLNEIKHIYKRLKSWYYDHEFYNLIGYRQIVSNYKIKSKIGFSNLIKDLLLEESNEKVKISLKQFVIDKLPTEDKIDSLGYKKYNETLFLLLAINVFPSINNFTDGNFRNYRFDFYSYENEKWSLEHIFPQNPNSNNFNIKDDKDWVLTKIEKIKETLIEEEKSKFDSLIERISKDEEIMSNEIDFIFDEISDHDTLGNMALLSGRVNSSLSNGFFNTKRKILLNKINHGSFVPKHTIDVFSKMLEIRNEDGTNLKFDDSLTVWSNNDVEAHFIHIKQSIKKLIEKLQVI